MGYHPSWVGSVSTAMSSFFHFHHNNGASLQQNGCRADLRIKLKITEELSRGIVAGAFHSMLLDMWKWHYLHKLSQWRHFACCSVGPRDPVVPLWSDLNAVPDWQRLSPLVHWMCLEAALLISGVNAVYKNIFEVCCPPSATKGNAP